MLLREIFKYSLALYFLSGNGHSYEKMYVGAISKLLRGGANKPKVIKGALKPLLASVSLN